MGLDRYKNRSIIYRKMLIPNLIDLNNFDINKDCQIEECGPQEVAYVNVTKPLSCAGSAFFHRYR